MAFLGGTAAGLQVLGEDAGEWDGERTAACCCGASGCQCAMGAGSGISRCGGAGCCARCGR